MHKLIKLELNKFKIKSNIRGVVIADLVLLAFLFLIAYLDKLEGESMFLNYDEAFLMISTLVKCMFTIFAAVLISKFIISEYKNNTISLMFMYPINRKKILLSKLLIVGIFTFLTVLISQFFISIIFYLINTSFNFIPDVLTTEIIYKNAIKFWSESITTTGVSLIPLFFGMRKKSVPATIISSIIIVSLLNSTSNGFTLSSIVIIPVAFAIAGVLIAYSSIKNIEHIDAM